MPGITYTIATIGQCVIILICSVCVSDILAWNDTVTGYRVLPGFAHPDPLPGITGGFFLPSNATESTRS